MLALCLVKVCSVWFYYVTLKCGMGLLFVICNFITLDKKTSVITTLVDNQKNSSSTPKIAVNLAKRYKKASVLDNAEENDCLLGVEYGTPT